MKQIINLIGGIILLTFLFAPITKECPQQTGINLLKNFVSKSFKEGLTSITINKITPNCKTE